MPRVPSTIDGAPWLHDIIKKNYSVQFYIIFFGNKYSLVAVTLSRFRMKKKMLRTKKTKSTFRFVSATSIIRSDGKDNQKSQYNNS